MAFPDSSIHIGPVAIRPPLVLAPLHEITDQPFRRMVRELGGVGLTVSEMISCEALIRHARKAERMMLASEGERPFAMQLVGNDPAHLAEAARMAEGAGADLVDLNMGCPASHVTSGGAGSALMRDFRRAEACVAALARAVQVPLTVKMRVGWDAGQKERGDYLDFMRMFADQGVQALSLHPRTRSQQYQGRADWSFIARAVEAGMPYPIIGNGDVLTAEDARRMARETGCQGVMIGRAALTNPWIFRQVLDPGFQVTEAERIDACSRFFRLLLETLEEREAVHKIKKIGGWFTKGIRNGALFRQRLNQVHEAPELIRELEALKEGSGGDPGPAL